MLTLSKIAALESQSLRTDLPDFRVGDTVAVNYKIVASRETKSLASRSSPP